MLAAHGERITAAEVQVKHMQEAQAALIMRFEKAVESTGKTMKEMCADLKVLKTRIPGPGAIAAEEAVEKAFENQPVGYLNTMLKKIFTNPVFWALIGWALIKIVLFGEYPSFIQKTRPYMAPVVKSQQDVGTLEYHFKDSSGREVILTPMVKPNNGLGAEKK